MGTAQGFGFGGAMAMAFFPDLSNVNVFLSENGLGPMDDLLYGGGGNGRGGMVGGPTFGGAGWGLVAETSSALRSAELAFGGGGFDMGYALGGDDNSVLSIGAVLGGGAAVLTVRDLVFEEAGIETRGLEPVSTTREIGAAMAFVQPYVSMCAQLLPWVGFELRIGYLLPLVTVNFGNLVGIPAPSLGLSGWTVSLGIVFGGIGSEETRDVSDQSCVGDVTAMSGGSFVVGDVEGLTIQNGIGEIVVSSYEAETQSGSVVVWQAVRTASANEIRDLQVVTERDEYGVTLYTTGIGRVDYTVQVPVGTDLSVGNGTGTVAIGPYDALTVIVENGVGDVFLSDLDVAALIVANGVGHVELDGVDAGALIVDVGVGDVNLSLPVSASARITAKASLGNVSIDRFPGMTGGVAGFIGKTGDVTLGVGENTIELHVGIGRIDVRMVEP